MLPISDLFKDLYNERWGDPLNSKPAGARNDTRDGRRSVRFPSAWSFTIRRRK